MHGFLPWTHGHMYMRNGPLFYMETGTMKDQYNYLEEKFPDEPWNEVKSSVIIDEWLKSQSLNEFGDSLKTMYTGGNPLFSI